MEQGSDSELRLARTQLETTLGSGGVALFEQQLDQVSQPSSEIVAQARQALHTRLGKDEGGNTSSLRPNRATSRFDKRRSIGPSTRTMLAAVAAVALVIGVGRTVVLQRHSSAPSQTYATRAGQRISMTLEDGTRVTLAPATQFTVAKNFGRETRAVTVSGEAYFDVSSSSRAPFVVRTGAISTHVLGTRFTVRHYDRDEAVQVAVGAGKVRAAGPAASATIVAGRAALITDSTAVVTTVNDLGQYTDWTTGELVFRRTPVPVLLATVGRWYGYAFQVADSSLLERRISLTLKVSDPQEMTMAIKGLLDVDMTFHGSVILLTPRRRTPPASRIAVPTTWIKPAMEIGR